jgi:SAM-dependent methyltransferase
MLKLAGSRRGVVTAAARVPGLPFPDGLFDAVVANLVISHIPDLTAGLEDMVRVLRPGGRVGVTAWAPDPAHADSQGREADEIVAGVRDACGLPSETPVHGAPWEEQLRDRKQLVAYLANAGLLHVDATAHTYRRVFAIDDYLSGWGGLGRYLRWQAGDERWHDFSDRAAAELRQRFGSTIVSVKRAWVATGSAP